MPLPRYHRIYLHLRQRIADGDYSEGDVVPGEMDLADQFQVSRITTRRALDELERAGLVTRERGRGTRVKAGAVDSPAFDGSLESLEASNRAIGGSQVGLIDFALAIPPPDVRIVFDLHDGERLWRIERIRTSGGDAFAHVVAWVPEAIGRTFSPADLESTMLVDLIERAGADIDRAEQTISATLADPQIAAALGVDTGAPLLRVVRTIFSQDGRPVERFTALFRPDRYRISMQLARRDSDADSRFRVRE
ncbi:MAG: GntR family transcriptional regulator [Rhizobiaceae bacterium]